MLNENIKDRLAILNPTYKSYITSPEFKKTIQLLSGPHGFDDKKSIVFENGLVLFLLFFFTKDDFVDFLKKNCDLDDNDSRSLQEASAIALPKEIKLMFDNTYNDFFKN